jgi:hypothetical protein
MMVTKELAMTTNTIPDQQTMSHQDAQFQNADYSVQNLTLDDLEFAEFHRHFVCAEFSTE